MRSKTMRSETLRVLSCYWLPCALDFVQHLTL